MCERIQWEMVKFLRNGNIYENELWEEKIALTECDGDKKKREYRKKAQPSRKRVQVLFRGAYVTI